jgi:uncharacterized membrane protein YecN with MAPEG domain
LPESLAAIMQDPVFMGFTVISWHSINGNEWMDTMALGIIAFIARRFYIDGLADPAFPVRVMIVDMGWIVAMILFFSIH